MDEGAEEGKNGRGRELNRESARQTARPSWSQCEWVGGVQGSPRAARGVSVLAVPAVPAGPGALSGGLRQLTACRPRQG